MLCVHCSTPVPDSAAYCPTCGSQVSATGLDSDAPDGLDTGSLKHIEQLLHEDTADEFRIEGMLGRGGMAVVYLATEVRLARKVAIKVLPPELTYGHGIQRFEREARLVANLEHPNIVPIYRISSGEQLFWYAMQFLEGRSLDDVLHEKGRFSLEETIPILEQVAEALDYAHERQVIHRDIKPSNVMLDAKGRVVVTDFGIAKARSEGTLTASGSVVGTPYYMSPEQGMGKPVTGASDQYSVAVMAYRMLSGQVPFEGDSAVEIVHKHCTMPPTPLDILAAGVPPHAVRAVHKALEKKPHDRLPSVGAFVDALRRSTRETAASAAPTVRTPPSRQPVGKTEISRAKTQVVGTSPRRTGRRTWAAIGFVAVVAILGTWLMTRGGTPAVTDGSTESTPGEAAASQPAVEPSPAVVQPLGAPPAEAAAAAADLDAEPGPPEPDPIAARGQAGETDLPDRAAPAAAETAAATPGGTGIVSVTGLPAGGMVSVDGRRQLGTTFQLAAGVHVIRMAARGYVRMDTTVTVAAGQTITIQFNARPLPFGGA